MRFELNQTYPIVIDGILKNLKFRGVIADSKGFYAEFEEPGVKAIHTFKMEWLSTQLVVVVTDLSKPEVKK